MRINKFMVFDRSIERLRNVGITCSVLAIHKIEDHSRELLFLLGLAMLHSASAEFAYAGKGSYGDACNGLLQLLEGTFGALLTAAAGVGAIVASAVGGFKMAWSLIVVSVGAFILRSYITLFNGTCNGAGINSFNSPIDNLPDFGNIARN